MRVPPGILPFMAEKGAHRVSIAQTAPEEDAGSGRSRGPLCIRGQKFTDRNTRSTGPACTHFDQQCLLSSPRSSSNPPEMGAGQLVVAGLRLSRVRVSVVDSTCG